VKEKHKLLILFFVALVARLIALPHAQVEDADATSRLMLGEWANNHGGELSSLQWPALQIYFVSLGQLIFGDRVLGPVILSLLIGAASIIPFYLFTRDVFNREGAFYAALLFTFSPLIFRNSFLPLSEIYHVFFSLITIWSLTNALKKSEKKYWWITLAGISSTIACGGRFEAWVLCGLLGVILLLCREWKLFLIFGFLSAIFPVIWMIYCYEKTGDPFISLEMVRHQNLDIGKINENYDAAKRVYRIIFFPLSWFVAVFPVVAVIIFGMFPRIIRSRKEEPLRLMFSCLFIFFLGFFITQSLKGLLANQHRYTITLVMLSLPLFALWFEKRKNSLERKIKWKAIVSVVIASLMIPWSFSWQRAPLNILAVGNPLGYNMIAQIVVTTYREMFAVPQIKQTELVNITQKIKKDMKPGEGLFIDFWEWNGSYYITQQSPPGAHLFCSYYANPHNGDNGRMEAFFRDNPKGQIMLSDYSSISREIKLHGSLMQFDSMPGALMLTQENSKSHFRLFRYNYLTADQTKVQLQTDSVAPPLYIQEKDLSYYEYCVMNNQEMMETIWKKNGMKNMEDEIPKVAADLMQWEKDNPPPK
jgi:hypothetical protein